MRDLRRHLTLVAALFVLAAGAAGCGSSDSDDPQPVAAPPGTQGPREPCQSAPPGTVADGVNDDQGGSRPGTDPCSGE